MSPSAVRLSPSAVRRSPFAAGREPCRFSPPNIANCETIRKWVAGINHELIDACDPCRAADGGDNGFVRADLRFFDEPTGEERAENAFVDEVLIQPS